MVARLWSIERNDIEYGTGIFTTLFNYGLDFDEACATIAEIEKEENAAFVCVSPDAGTGAVRFVFRRNQ